MILTITIDMNKLPEEVNKRCLMLVDTLHELAHSVAVLGNHRTSVIPINDPRRTYRIGEWQVGYDTGIDS